MPSNISQNYLPIIGISLAVFTGLLLVYCATNRTGADARSLVTDYQELVEALDDAGVFPLGDADQLLAAYAGLLSAEKKIGQDIAAVFENHQVRLGTVMVGKIRESSVYEIELRPQSWQEFRPGKVRDILKTISRIGQNDQLRAAVNANPYVSSKNFFFSVAVNSQPYVITPIFQDQQCILLILRPTA